ncbi:unnamed protein product, partial [Mesorhabditis belari]|uniref:Uncharacterized protein n=1 Tax=Mesorhabditis belari TaxID=2138241 RepID=A0AAF3EDG2_9BILA
MEAPAEFNRLVFERTRLTNDYCTLAAELESLLEAVRYDISKAKTINGLSLSTNILPGAIDLEPYARVHIDNSRFSLHEDGEERKEETAHRRKGPANDDEPKEEENKAEKRVKLPQGAYRPFGVLEPEAAKMARKEAAHSLKICCEMAGIRSRICTIDQRLEVLKAETPELVEQIKKLVL